MRRFVRSQTLWSRDDAAWPSYENGEIIFLRQGPPYSFQEMFNSNLLVMPMSPIMLLGPVQLEEHEVYLDLVLSGTMVTTDFNTQGPSDAQLRIVATGLPRSDVQDPLFAHPVGDRGKTLANNAQRTGYCHTGLVVRSHVVNTNFVGSHDCVGAPVNSGWPWYNRAHAVGDAWHLGWNVGRKVGQLVTSINVMTSGTDFEVSGYEKIWFQVVFRNPSLMSPTAEFMVFSMRLHALVYEEWEGSRA